MCDLVATFNSKGMSSCPPVFRYSFLTTFQVTTRQSYVAQHLFSFCHMIVDVIVDFVWLPYNSTKLLAILQFPRPSCLKHRRGYACQTTEKEVLIALSLTPGTYSVCLCLSLSIYISLFLSSFRL